MEVGEEDVAVDVGDDQVEGLGEGLKGRGVAMIDVDAVETVDGDVLDAVLHAPFVEIDGHAMFGTAHTGEDGEDARAATHVEEGFPFHIRV